MRLRKALVTICLVRNVDTIKPVLRGHLKDKTKLS